MPEYKMLTSSFNGTNCYFVHDQDKNCILIDADGDLADFERVINKNGFHLTHILLTHGHFDHISLANELRSIYGCKVCAGADEQQILENPQLNLSCRFANDNIVKADILFEDGEQFQAGGITVKVLSTPGHTKGGVCYVIDDLLLCGDTLFAGDCGRTDLPTGNWNTLRQSLHRLYSMDGEYFVLPGHGPASTMERERRVNSYLNGSI